MSDYDQTDEMIPRDRASRRIVAMASPVIGFAASILVMLVFTKLFLLPSYIGWALGAGLGVITLAKLIPRLYVTNEAVGAFVTVDLVTKELVSYGPGFHWAFPWEARKGANNVFLKEREVKFDFSVQTRNGTLSGSGSVRYRPDIRGLPAFLAGAGSVGPELTDIITSSCVKILARKDVMKAVTGLHSLNEKLAEEFKDRRTPFEERFGVRVGDVTVSQLLPSKEVQKAIDGVAERAALDSIIAQSLGYATMADVFKAVGDKENPLTSADVTRATEMAAAITDNLGGMKVNRESKDINIRLNPEAMEAAKHLGSAGGAALGAAFGSSKKGGK